MFPFFEKQILLRTLITLSFSHLYLHKEKFIVFFPQREAFDEERDGRKACGGSEYLQEFFFKKKEHKKGGSQPQIAYFTVLPRISALMIGCVFGAKTSYTENNEVGGLTFPHFNT